MICQSTLVRKYRKVLAFAIALAFIFPTGCIKKTEQIALDTAKRNTVSFGNELSTVALFDGLSEITGFPIRESDLELISMTRNEGNTYLLALLYEKIRVVTINDEFRITSAVLLDFEGNGSAEQLFVASDGTWFLIVRNADDGLWEQNYALYHFDTEGREISAHVDLKELDGKSIQGTDFDGGGLFCILTESEIMLYDSDGKLQSRLNAPSIDAYQSAILAEDGMVMILSINSKSEASLISWSYDAQKVVSTKEISGVESSEWYDARLIKSVEGDEAGCYLETQQRLYLYYPDSDCLEICFDKGVEGFYNEMPLLCSGPMMFETIGYSAFAVGATASDLQKTGIYSITVTPRSENIKTIRIGVCVDTPMGISEYAGTFRRQYPECDVEIVDYSTESEEGGTSIARLNADILSGNGPDILCLSADYIYLYDNAEILLDLSNFVQNDPQFDTDLLLPKAWNIGSSNQSFKWVTPFFGVKGLMGKQERVSETIQYDLDEFGMYITSLPDEAHIIRHDTAKNLFLTLYSFYRNELFSQDAADFWFDWDVFNQLLDFGEEFGVPPYTDSKAVAIQLQNDETLYLSETISNYEIFLCYASYFGGNVGYMGSPGANNGKPILESDYYFGISAQTQMPEEAWSFLKCLLSSEVQDRYDSYGISGDKMPVLLSSFDSMIKSGYENYINGTSMRNELYSDMEFEQEMENIEKIIAAMTSGNDFDRGQDTNPPTFPFVEEDIAQAFTEMIMSAETILTSDPEVDKIVFEELEAYFSGQKAREDCLELIENRLQTYITEKG